MVDYGFSNLLEFIVDHVLPFSAVSLAWKTGAQSGLPEHCVPLAPVLRNRPFGQGEMLKNVSTKISKIAGFAIVASCVVYFAIYVKNNFANLPSLDLSGSHFWLVAATSIIMCCLSMANVAVAWVILMRSLGAPMRLRPALGVVYATQIGKYLPSNVFHFVGRVAVAKRLGCSYLATSASLVLEIVWIIGVGMVFIIAGLSLLGSESAILGQKIPLAGILLILPVAAMMWPPLLRRLAKLAASRVPRLAPLADAPLPDFRGLFACLALYSLTFVLLGLNLYFIATLFTEGPLSLSVWGFIWIGGGAWLIGFVTPGSPGGLGVREALLVAFLDPHIGPGAGIGVSLAFRVVTVVADGLTFLIGTAMLAHTMRTSSVVTSQRATEAG